MKSFNFFQKALPLMATVVLVTTGYSQNEHPLRYVDLESNADGTAYLSPSTMDLTDPFNGEARTFIYESSLNPPAPVITSQEKYKGERSIQYIMSGTTWSERIEKSQHRVYDNLSFDHEAYFGFAIKLDNSMDQPNKPLTFFQLSQGSPFSPPLAMSLVPGNSGNVFKYVLEIRDDANALHGDPYLKYQDTIVQGKWYTFVLKVKSRSDGYVKPGEITLWKNNVPVHSGFENAGYTAGSEIDGYAPADDLEVFVGPDREQDAAIVNMYFDEIRYATNYFSACPDAALDAKESRKVLFVGNSYTYRENAGGENLMPEMIAAAAASTGNQCLYEFRTQASHKLIDHANPDDTLKNFDENAVATIDKGTWNYVVLQEQSAVPSYSDERVERDFYPAINSLVKEVKDKNPSAQTILYQTWGHNDTSDFQNYVEMDDKISARYRIAADSFGAVLSPVGAVRRYLRDNYPALELYLDDDSHPTHAGTYAAACTFYTVLFRKDPSLITYNGGLDAADAAIIREAAREIVFERLGEWNVGDYDSTFHQDKSLGGAQYASVAWVNTNNGTGLQAVESGKTGPCPDGECEGEPEFRMYDYIDNNFERVTGNLPGAVYDGAVTWGDFNNDGLIDVFVCGNTNLEGTDQVSIIYTNNGDNDFSEAFTLAPSLSAASAAWGDYDNDGDIDLVFAGNSSSGPAVYLYKNTRERGYEGFENSDIQLLPSGDSRVVEWVDYDRDLDLDLCIAGTEAGVSGRTRLYRNNGGTFEEINVPFTGYSKPSIAWGDFDGDRDLDVAISGRDQNFVMIYRNNGGFFEGYSTYYNMHPINGKLKWMDGDGDNDPDLFLSGSFDGKMETRLLINEQGAFTYTSRILDIGMSDNDVAFADYDTDGDLDFLLTGTVTEDSVTKSVARVYMNDGSKKITPSATPEELWSEVNNQEVTLHWESPTDNDITYNVVVGTGPGMHDIMSANSFLENGTLKMSGQGNAGTNTAWRLRGLSPGIYYWSVQAVNSGYTGSAFAAEQSFRINVSNSALTICNFGTPVQTPLPSTFFNSGRAYTLGEGGPDLSSMYQFELSWVSERQGLDNFQFRTSVNGADKLWNLKPYTTIALGEPSPSLTITNSNYPGLDGKYFVKSVSNTAFIMVSATGNHTLYFTNSSTAPSCETLRVGSENEESLQSFSLSPNPAKDAVELTTNMDAGNCSVEVYNSIGSLFEVPYSFNGNKIRLDVNKLEKGLYFVKLTTGHNHVMKKLLIEK